MGRGDGQVRRAEVYVVVWGATAVLSTDKTIYRPGQELRMRALWQRAPEGVLAGAAVTFEVRDPRGGLVFSRRAETSEAGIASADWSIPEHVGEGSYRITAAAEAFGGEAVQSVEIAPYELPRFTVTLEPARPWFVAGEEPRVVVAVASLAGALIPGARVEVEPEWWPEAWGPAPRAEGTTGPAGTAGLPFDLARYREGLDGGDAASSPFRDVAVVATARHPASGREERARARLRLTRDPIHVYPVDWSLPGPSGPAAGVPHPVYVTTFTAGGEPVACEVGATLLRGEEVLSVARFRTNELGVGRLDARQLATGLLRAVPETGTDRHELEVEVVVQDREGRTGRTRFLVHRADTGAPVAIEAAGSILAPGEPVGVRLVPLPNRWPETAERPARLLVTLEE
ncbi:MAG TPA: MG2 domain-containing protein, partial [Thermoanaerobaculia bacterium]